MVCLSLLYIYLFTNFFLDFEELRLLSHDAGHAKEVAEGELRNFESKSEARKMLRDREVNNQKNAMQSRVNFAKRLEEQEKERYQKEVNHIIIINL
jgi:hypothetical protein